MNPAKAAELIKMLFGLRTRVGPRNNVLGSIFSPIGRGIFEGGEEAAHCEVQGHHCAVKCTKTSEPTETQFGLWAWMGQGSMY